jgi:hypothetical protein
LNRLFGLLGFLSLLVFLGFSDSFNQCVFNAVKLGICLGFAFSPSFLASQLIVLEQIAIHSSENGEIPVLEDRMTGLSHKGDCGLPGIFLEARVQVASIAKDLVSIQLQV